MNRSIVFEGRAAPEAAVEKLAMLFPHSRLDGDNLADWKERRKIPIGRAARTGVAKNNRNFFPNGRP